MSASRPSGMGDYVTAMNTNGLAVGNNLAGAVGNYPYATLWTRTGSTWGSYTATDLLAAVPSLNTALNALYAANPNGGATSVTKCALAVNNSGTLVVAASNQGYANWSPNLPGDYYICNAGTQQYASLGSLKMYDPIAANLSYNGGHEQCINDSGAVVGYTGTQGSTWSAAIWQNGTITDLNTLYGPSGANILTGMVLNNATAIDNNGDIVGYGTDSHGTYQAFEILNVATPEPGTMTLLAAGLVGLLAYAWRKRK